MSLDDNLNDTLGRIANLLQTVEIAILIVAIALAVLMIGIVGVCYYDKYKKYQTLSNDDSRSSSSYKRSHYHPADI